MVSGFPFSTFGVSSVLLVSAGREMRFLSCECRSGRNAVAMWRRLVSRPVWASRVVGCLRVVSSFLAAAILVVAVVPFRVRLVGCVVWRRVWRRVVGAWRRGGVWLLDVGCAVWRGGVACRGACRGRFGDAVSCGGACDTGRAAGRMARRGRSE